MLFDLVHVVRKEKVHLFCFLTDIKNEIAELQEERLKRNFDDSRMGELADCKTDSSLCYSKEIRETRVETSRSVCSAPGPNGPRKNYVCAHPSYLKTLGQTHSDWIFGAIAEFVDNSRDAKATMYSYIMNILDICLIIITVIPYSFKKLNSVC